MKRPSRAWCCSRARHPARKWRSRPGNSTDSTSRKMAEITPETIVVRFDADASRWSASFQSVPQVEYGGDLPLRAVRRLLEGIVAWPDNYPLHFDPDDSGHGVPHRW